VTPLDTDIMLQFVEHVRLVRDSVFVLTFRCQHSHQLSSSCLHVDHVQQHLLLPPLPHRVGNIPQLQVRILESFYFFINKVPKAAVAVFWEIFVIQHWSVISKVSLRGKIWESLNLYSPIGDSTQFHWFALS
jgi:hypothetical protein